MALIALVSVFGVVIIGGGAYTYTRRVTRVKRAVPTEVALSTSPSAAISSTISGAKFNPNTGQPIPKFDPQTGKQNWV